MFKIIESYEVDRRILKPEYIRYSPAEKTTNNTPNNQIYINISRQESVISLLNSYLELNFEFIKKADKSRYATGDDIRLVNLGPLVLFFKFKITSSSGKHPEDISHAHFVSSLYKLISNAKASDHSSIGFDRDRNRRRNELTNNKHKKGKFHVRIMPKDLFEFAKHQEKLHMALVVD